MSSTLTNLLFHIVFSTKKRAPLITSSVRGDLYRYMGGITRGEGGHLLEVGGIPDHVHLLVRFSPSVSVSEMLKRIKCKSSGWINRSRGLDVRFSWQAGYGGFSVSRSQVESVRRYIRNQEAHHRKSSFKQELVELLEKHGVEYDERYLFD